MSTLSPLASPSGSGSQWIYETVKGCHEFKIKGYSLAKGMGVVGGYDWVLLFDPDGDSESCTEYVSLFVKIVSSTEKVRALYEFKLLDQTGKGIHSLPKDPKSPRTFTSGYSWEYSQYMKRSELETSSYLKNDCLTIHFTVEVVQDHFETAQSSIEEGKHYVIPVPPSDMIQNLKGLLESEIGSDVTFQAMLLFLYSDELPEPRELSDSDSLCTATTIMQHLLGAADRFDLARLRLMCEEKLCEEVTASTAATTLALAEQHQCLQLKTVCLNFAAKPENLGEIVKSGGFAYLEKSCPSLLIDLLKTSAVVDKNVG
ncbi:hypothetical protein MKW98_001828 [Papaver atlanticum]|uniref:MATH domain-containing protein n=1 Tax=Papaver atlanticum TaxID=357466 RepID=A0AAD4SAK4_9MAGN|nr:hypothetical protein MKW98_001828 [Papaver atlanticum]